MLSWRMNTLKNVSLNCDLFHKCEVQLTKDLKIPGSDEEIDQNRKKRSNIWR